MRVLLCETTIFKSEADNQQNRETFKTRSQTEFQKRTGFAMDCFIKVGIPIVKIFHFAHTITTVEFMRS